MQLCSVWRNRDRLVDKARHLDRSVAVRAVSDVDFRRCGDPARTLDAGPLPVPTALYNIKGSPKSSKSSKSSRRKSKSKPKKVKVADTVICE